MDFIDWCSTVLRAAETLMEDDPHLRLIGAVFGPAVVEQDPSFRQSKRHEGL